MNGYGSFYLRGRHVGAHRMAWKLSFGSVPPGLYVLHRCDNKRCCNPGHLFVGTPADNNNDKLRKFRHGGKIETRSRILSIRSDGRSSRIIARELGVSNTTILRIKRGQSWEWLK